MSSSSSSSSSGRSSKKSSSSSSSSSGTSTRRDKSDGSKSSSSSSSSSASPSSSSSSSSSSRSSSSKKSLSFCSRLRGQLLFQRKLSTPMVLLAMCVLMLVLVIGAQSGLLPSPWTSSSSSSSSSSNSLAAGASSEGKTMATQELATDTVSLAAKLRVKLDKMKKAKAEREKKEKKAPVAAEASAVASSPSSAAEAPVSQEALDQVMQSLQVSTKPTPLESSPSEAPMQISSKQKENREEEQEKEKKTAEGAEKKVNENAATQTIPSSLPASSAPAAVSTATPAVNAPSAPPKRPVRMKIVTQSAPTDAAAPASAAASPVPVSTPPAPISTPPSNVIAPGDASALDAFLAPPPPEPAAPQPKPNSNPFGEAAAAATPVGAAAAGAGAGGGAAIVPKVKRDPFDHSALIKKAAPTTPAAASSPSSSLPLVPAPLLQAARQFQPEIPLSPVDIPVFDSTPLLNQPIALMAETHNFDVIPNAVPIAPGARGGAGALRVPGAAPVETAAMKRNKELLAMHYAKLEQEKLAKMRHHQDGHQPDLGSVLPTFITPSSKSARLGGAIDESMAFWMKKANVTQVPEVRIGPSGGSRKSSDMDGGDWGGGGGGGGGSSSSTEKNLIFGEEVQFVIITTGDNHPIVSKSLQTWGRYVQRISVFSDTVDEELGTIVLQNPAPEKELTPGINKEKIKSWRVSGMLEFLHKSLPAPFYIVLSDLSFPLLDVLRQRLDLYKLAMKGDYPPFIAGRKNARKYEKTLYADQRKLGDAFFGNKGGAALDSSRQKIRKLESVNSYLYGFNREFVKYVSDYLVPDSCPVLFPDDLALAGIISCAGGHVPGSLFDFIPQTRWMPREFKLNEKSSLENWRLYDCYHNLNHVLRVEESYQWYYPKLEKMHAAKLEKEEKERVEKEIKEQEEAMRRQEEQFQ